MTNSKNQLVVILTANLALIPILCFLSPVLLDYFSFPTFEYSAGRLSPRDYFMFYFKKYFLWLFPAIFRVKTYFFIEKMRTLYLRGKNCLGFILFFIPRMYTSLFIDKININFLIRMFMTYQAMRQYVFLELDLNYYFYENEKKYSGIRSYGSNVIIAKIANMVCFFLFMCIPHALGHLILGSESFAPAIVLAVSNYVMIFDETDVSFFGIRMSGLKGNFASMFLSLVLSGNYVVIFGYFYGLIYAYILTEEHYFKPFLTIKRILQVFAHIIYEILDQIYVFLKRDQLNSNEPFELFKSLFYTIRRTGNIGRTTGVRARVKKVVVKKLETPGDSEQVQQELENLDKESVTKKRETQI